MPRPYNLIGYEGSYGRASGLHGFGTLDDPNVTALTNLGLYWDLPSNPVTSGTPGVMAPGYQQYLNSLQPTFGDWVQQHLPWLVVGGVGLLLLTRRRR